MTKIASMSALIGYTGFVGGTLARARGFDQLYNTTNIEAVRGLRFDRVVCAGAPAEKWRANLAPDEDWRGISRLIDNLTRVAADCFVLISTVDVYPKPFGCTEDDAPARTGLHAYGRHRLALEEFVQERFARHVVVRLPALFGIGLKKNALYDLMRRKQTRNIAPNATFQWYPVARLADDLARIEATGLELVNITAEPVEMAEVRGQFFPDLIIGPPAADPPRYDVRSRHDGLLGGSGGYHLSREQVMAKMAAFVDEATAALSSASPTGTIVRGSR